MVVTIVIHEYRKRPEEKGKSKKSKRSTREGKIELLKNTRSSRGSKEEETKLREKAAVVDCDRTSPYDCAYT